MWCLKTGEILHRSLGKIQVSTSDYPFRSFIFSFSIFYSGWSEFPFLMKGNFKWIPDFNLQQFPRSSARRRRAGEFPFSRLMGMCRWVGSNLHDWVGYNRAAFSGIELLEWGGTFAGFWFFPLVPSWIGGTMKIVCHEMSTDATWELAVGDVLKLVAR